MIPSGGLELYDADEQCLSSGEVFPRPCDFSCESVDAECDAAFDALACGHRCDFAAWPRDDDFEVASFPAYGAVPFFGIEPELVAMPAAVGFVVDEEVSVYGLVLADQRSCRTVG
jgi:hypothetical protein